MYVTEMENLLITSWLESEGRRNLSFSKCQVRHYVLKISDEPESLNSG